MQLCDKCGQWAQYVLREQVWGEIPDPKDKRKTIKAIVAWRFLGRYCAQHKPELEQDEKLAFAGSIPA